MVAEARLEDSEAGLVAATDGWFVVNVRDAAWVANEKFGAACIFEGDEAPFPELGFTLEVLEPGQPSGFYHAEANQEDSSSSPANASSSAKERSAPSAPGISSTVGRGPSTSSSGPATAPASSSWQAPVGSGRDRLPALGRGAPARRGSRARKASPEEAYAPFPTWWPGRPEGAQLPTT